MTIALPRASVRVRDGRTAKVATCRNTRHRRRRNHCPDHMCARGIEERENFLNAGTTRGQTHGVEELCVRRVEQLVLIR